MSYSSSAAGKRFPPPALRVTRINRGQSGLDLAPGRTSSRQISLACLGPVGLGIPLYVSESRTTVAMRWLVRALGILFAAVVARGASVFGFSFVCGTLPECAAGPGVEASFLALGIAFVLSQIAGGLLFLYGFATVLAARLEFGPDHVRHVERARVFLSLTVVLLLVGFFAPFLLLLLLVSRRIGQKFRSGQFQRSWPPGFPASSGLLPEVPVRPPTPPLGP